MATYFDIHGQKVEKLTSDPSNLTLGQVWYNATAAEAKVRTGLSNGVFSSAPSLNAGHVSAGAAGITSAALAFGSTSSPNESAESYNGSSWTAITAMPANGDHTSGFGTQTAAVSAGDGGPSPAKNSHLWNGSSWTTGNPTSQYGYAGVAIGITSAGMLASRFDGSGPGPATYVELFNGTCWTNSPNDLNTARYNAQGAGTQGAAIIMGGGPGTPQGVATEEYNGGSWTTVNSLNSAMMAGNASGQQTAAVCFDEGICEIWDGTCWSANPSGMSTPRSNLNNTIGAGPAGTSSTSLAVGGGSSPHQTVEEYSGPGSIATQTITVS